MYILRSNWQKISKGRLGWFWWAI